MQRTKSTTITAHCRNEGIKYINNNKQMTEKQTNEDRREMRMYGQELERTKNKNSEYTFFVRNFDAAEKKKWKWCCLNNKEIIIHHCLLQLFFLCF